MMNPMFKKLVEDKQMEGKSMSPVEKQGTGNVLQELMHFLDGLQGDKLKGLKKVTVASNDPKGLAMGLDKAKGMVEGDDTDMSADDSDESSEDGSEESEEHEDPEHEANETPEEEEAEMHDGTHDENDPEALKHEIAMLKAQLATRR